MSDEEFDDYDDDQQDEMLEDDDFDEEDSEQIQHKKSENDELLEEIPTIVSGVQSGNWLRFEGCTHFRQRLICATLSGRQIRIENIRANDRNPGIRDFEASFLRLLEKLTNGSEIIINEIGTLIAYKPGVIVGGSITHDCGKSRSMGYFIDALVSLGPFGKKNLHCILTGITNDSQDISVDLVRTVTIPLMKKFGIGEEDGLELKVQKRGAPPEGGGQITLKVPIVRQLKPLILVDDGKVRRIRGIAYATKVAPTLTNRIVDSARGILNKFMQDVYIYNDHYKGSEAGNSPGFALTLVAETTTGCALGSEVVASGGSDPEEIGVAAAKLLLMEVKNRGCVDTAHQSWALLYMVLCPDTITKIRLGRLTAFTMQYLRHLRDFFGVTFRIEPEEETNTLILTCRGFGYKNLAKKIA